ncbi:predicted protein [Postia placenta Mad-698-R]|nr:predicted protein [Postia placenta Mad-698-R]
MVLRAIYLSCTLREKPDLANVRADCLTQSEIAQSDILLKDDQPMIYYKRPNRAMMQFYSFGDGELDILPSREALDILGSKTDPARATLEHDFSRPAFNAQPALDATVLSQLNVAQLLADLVERAIHTTGHAPEDERSGAQLLHDPTPRIPTQTTSRLPKWLTRLALPMPMVLRDISATGRLLRSIHRNTYTDYLVAEQINVRTEQALFVMTQSTTFMQRDSSRTIDFISRYVKFYNCVWLVLNDIIIGVAFGSFLCENRLLLSRILDQCVQLYLVDSIKHALLWLDNWPAGLKLNTELSQFYCHTLLSVVSIWGYVLQCAAPYFPVFLWIAGTMGGCGMTMVVSLLSDALGFLTAHLYVCYLLTTTAFSQQLSLAGSLWNLFRGKRFNVLRNRLDSWDYDIDQLLLGTILFTLVAFLSPTVLTYYALFAATHLSTITLCAILDTVIALLNHFPLFALMLRIKDPMRLPGKHYSRMRKYQED